MERYAMCVRKYEDDKFPSADFIFQANNQEEAESFGLKWAMRRGLNYRLDVIVRLAHQNELTMRIHNEYLI